MRKLSKLFAVLLALVTVVSFSAAANAASVDEGALQAEVQESTWSHQLSYVSENSVGIKLSIPSDYHYWAETVIYNKNKKQIRQGYDISYASWYDLSKNNLYYYRVRVVYYDNGVYTPVSDWSKYVPFVCAKWATAKTRYNYSSGTKQITIKAPKVKGLKKFKIYVSTKKNKGYKKVATVKVGKKVTLKKYKGKNFKTGKTYYIKVVPNKGTNFWTTTL